MHSSVLIRKKLLDNATPSERKLYKTLDALNVNYIPQHVFPYGGSYILVDAFLPDHGVVIEADGMHHYINPTQCAKDMAREEYLLEVYGLKTIRYMNSLILGKGYKKVLGDLLSPVRQSRLG